MNSAKELVLNNSIYALARRLSNALRRSRFVAASEAEVERAESAFYREYLREGMTVFDVGAGTGALTLLFSEYTGADGITHAFEASSRNFEQLSDAYHVSGRDNIILNHLAVADREETLRLHVYDEDHLGWNSLAQRPLENYGISVKPVAVEEIAATTVDAYCARKKVTQIDLLKIDVEGAEYQVLLGAQEMLRRKLIRCVVFEFGQTTFDMGNRPAMIESYLREMNYKLRNLIAGDPVFPGRQSAENACFSMHMATPR